MNKQENENIARDTERWPVGDRPSLWRKVLLFAGTIPRWTDELRTNKTAQLNCLPLDNVCGKNEREWVSEGWSWFVRISQNYDWLEHMFFFYDVTSGVFTGSRDQGVLDLSQRKSIKRFCDFWRRFHGLRCDKGEVPWW